MVWLAAGLAALTFLVHTFVGGRVVARPLLADGHLPRASKWLSYYCWHIATVLLAAMAATLALLASGAFPFARGPALLFFGALSALLSVLSVGVAVRGGINPLRFPSTTLFAAIAVTCAGAIISQSPA